MISGVILAAGLSSRMGNYKPLLPIGDTLFITKLVDQMKSAGASRVIVVTGYRHLELESVLADQNVYTVFNSRYYCTQMIDSVKLGIRAVRESDEQYGTRTEQIILSPVDVVLSPRSVFDTVRKGNADFVRPVFQGRAGHPVGIREPLFDRILAYEGEGGLRCAVESSGCPIEEIEVDEPGILMDADTKDDYRRLVHAYDVSSGNTGLLHPDIEINISMDRVIFGEQFMQLLELINDTGSLQKTAGALKMSYTKIWQMIKKTEENTSEKLIERCSGGGNGGYSRLTEKGNEMLSRWKSMKNELDQVSQSVFNKYFEDFRL